MSRKISNFRDKKNRKILNLCFFLIFLKKSFVLRSTCRPSPFYSRKSSNTLRNAPRPSTIFMKRKENSKEKSRITVASSISFKNYCNFVYSLSD